MKKIALLILVSILLISCSKGEEEGLKIDIPYDEITRIQLETINQSMTIEKDEDWEKVIDTLTDFNYTLSDEEAVLEMIDNQEDLFIIEVTLENKEYSFAVYEDLSIVYIEKPSEQGDDTVIEFAFTRHEDINLLYEELSEVTFPMGSLKVKKPVIYLYPEEETDITVSLNTDMTLTTTYPKYNGEWHVRAYPNGLLVDENAVSYDYLYWEGIVDYSDDFEDGFVIAREEIIPFLEEKLQILGLNYSERNDFISYWLPELEAYNFIKLRFLMEEYEELVQLSIKPEPDMLIRVFMIFEGLDQDQVIKTQELEAITRYGYTVVEWGGAHLE
jgi:hypothetical protein